MSTTNTEYSELLTLAREAHALVIAKEMLEWDQETCMPTQGIELRAREVAALAGVIHERTTSPRVGELLEALGNTELAAGPAANVRNIRRTYDKARRVPAELVKEIAEIGSRAQEAWGTARKNADFGAFAPLLTRMVELKRQEAGHLSDGGPLYDALLDEFEEGATVEAVGTLLADLRDRLVPLVQRIQATGHTPDETVTLGAFPRAQQELLCREVGEALGFDLAGGRLDASAHPFTCGGLGDVRLTTRYDDGDPRPALFALIHEVGHGMYEQGVDPEHLGTPLGQSSSMGVHESQSRLWENQVGRSRAFCRYLFSRLVERFPDAVAGYDAEALYRAVNVVRPSLIRVEADEVTYNLHIVIRYEIERDLLSGDLEVADLPATWNRKYEELLGLTPPDDAQGCLQDVHWSWGLFGYFPTYTLGNLYAAQLFDRAAADIGDLDTRLAAGDTRPLLDWLREKIHRRGRLLLPADLIAAACGAPPSAQAFLAHLEVKYGELYGL